MRDIVYPGWFDDFWFRLREARKNTPMRTLGGKEEALNACIKLDIGPEDVDYLVGQYISQKHAKIAEIGSKGSCTPFKDISGWLNNRRFEDEPESMAVVEIKPDDKIQRLMSREWAE